MSLKTKLVMAITSLVFLITAVLSLVYVSQLLQSVVKQSYETNVQVAQQIRFALQRALETGLKDQRVNPNDPVQLRQLAAFAERDNEALMTVVTSAYARSERDEGHRERAILGLFLDELSNVVPIEDLPALASHVKR